MTLFGDPKFAQQAQLERVAAHGAEAEDGSVAAAEDHEAHAAGQVCGRCGLELTKSDAARRSATGQWVHESCP